MGREVGTPADAGAGEAGDPPSSAGCRVQGRPSWGAAGPTALLPSWIFSLFKGERAGAPFCSRRAGRPCRLGSLKRLPPEAPSSPLAVGAETVRAGRGPGGWPAGVSATRGLRSSVPCLPSLSLSLGQRGSGVSGGQTWGQWTLMGRVSPRAPRAGCFRDNARLRGRTCARTATATPPRGPGGSSPAGPAPRERAAALHAPDVYFSSFCPSSPGPARGVSGFRGDVCHPLSSPSSHL